jgi:hypothetical protein
VLRTPHTGLENRCARKRTEGSNPSPSVVARRGLNTISAMEAVTWTIALSVELAVSPERFRDRLAAELQRDEMAGTVWPGPNGTCRISLTVAASTAAEAIDAADARVRSVGRSLHSRVNILEAHVVNRRLEPGD